MPIQIRIISLLAIGVVASFFGVRAILVPPSFGQFGHYRGASVAEIAGTPIHHAGQEACLECHAGIDELRVRSAHSVIHCESCHGPLAKHAAEPAKNPVTLPSDGFGLCLRCHEKNASKPPDFVQVDPLEHLPGIDCLECHNPHVPEDNEP